jgi:DNA-binding MltR family transcriptional regulator
MDSNKSPRKPTTEGRGHWLALLNTEFEGSSDRSCVIVAASIIDHLLSEVLKTFLVPCATSDDPVFDGPNAPLGNFNSRINLAHRLGLVSAKLARDLHLIRRMRNDQAHSVEGRKFLDARVIEQVNHLTKSLDIRSRAPTLIDPPYDSIRGQFTIAAFMFIDHLDNMRAQITPFPLAQADDVYTSIWHEENPPP